MRRLAVTFVAKGPDKAAAQLQQERLADAEEVARWKALWKEQLARLASYLTAEPSRHVERSQDREQTGVIGAMAPSRRYR